MEQFGQTSGHGGRPQTDYQTPPESQAELPVALRPSSSCWGEGDELAPIFRERAHHSIYDLEAPFFNAYRHASPPHVTHPASTCTSTLSTRLGSLVTAHWGAGRSVLAQPTSTYSSLADHSRGGRVPRRRLTRGGRALRALFDAGQHRERDRVAHSLRHSRL